MWRWNGKDGFIGIRTKFGLRFLDMEIHWGLSKTFGTAQALEELGTIPDSISLKISLRTECGNCHGPLKYVKGHAEQDVANGEWLHNDGGPNCRVSALNDKAGKASPVAISNDALFAELQNTICDTEQVAWKVVLEPVTWLLKRVPGAPRVEDVL